MTGPFNAVHLIRQVDLFTLKLFLTVIEEGQVGRAAARENIAPSAATKRIQDLEGILGNRLFERNPRGVELTPAGQILARHLHQMFGTLDLLRRDFGEFNQGVRGRIRVASTGGIIFQYLSREVAEFARSFPMVALDLREGTNPEVVRALLAGDVDVGVFVMAAGLGAEALDVLDYRQDRLVAVVPATHALAERQSVQVSDLLAHNFIAIASTTTLMSHVRQAADAAGLPFEPRYTVSSVYAATSLVRVNQGVTIQPDQMITTQDMDFVRAVPLDEPWALRRLVVARAPAVAPHEAMQNFVRQLNPRAD